MDRAEPVRATLEEREQIYDMRCVQKLPYQPICEKFPHLIRSSIRRIVWEERQKRPAETKNTGPRIEGAYLSWGDIVDEEEVWRLAKQKARKKRELAKRVQENLIEFEQTPICMVWFADWHLGDLGVDYDKLDRDLDIIVNTPGMYAGHVGDVVNNFIIGRLQQIRLGASFSISEEWVMVKRVLKKIAPKLVSAVAGNHDLWSRTLTGVDYLEEIHKTLTPHILYSTYDQSFLLVAGGHEYRIRARHSWKGYSQFNDTHGIEKATKFDKGRDFDIGIGAHTHASGLYRQFNNGGQTGHAILCGTYKTLDDFAEQMGFPLANESAAVAMIFDKNGCWGTNNIEIAQAYMNSMYNEKEEKDA